MRAKKLNLLAMARKDRPFQSQFVPSEGYVFVSADLSAGEPTVVTHYSRDQNYYDATFGMVGKAPYMTENSLLKIDDVYLSALSFSPMYAALAQELFHSKFDGLTFSEQWLKDPDVIKDMVKKERQLCKIFCLGLSYGMGAKKLTKTAYDAGYVVTFKDAKGFKNNYWAWCHGVYKLSKYMEQVLAEKGYIENEFGYRVLPDAPYKSLNALIQSSVAGLMNTLLFKFFSIYPQARFVALIHDEMVAELPAHDLVNAKLAWDRAVESLNEDLGWWVAMRTGWKIGNNFYEAK